MQGRGRGRCWLWAFCPLAAGTRGATGLTSNPHESGAGGGARPPPRRPAAPAPSSAGPGRLVSARPRLSPCGTGARWNSGSGWVFPLRPSPPPRPAPPPPRSPGPSRGPSRPRTLVLRLQRRVTPPAASGWPPGTAALLPQRGRGAPAAPREEGALNSHGPRDGSFREHLLCAGPVQRPRLWNWGVWGGDGQLRSRAAGDERRTRAEPGFPRPGWDAGDSAAPAPPAQAPPRPGSAASEPRVSTFCTVCPATWPSGLWPSLYCPKCKSEGVRPVSHIILKKESM